MPAGPPSFAACTTNSFPPTFSAFVTSTRTGFVHSPLCATASPFRRTSNELSHEPLIVACLIPSRVSKPRVNVTF